MLMAWLFGGAELRRSVAKPHCRSCATCDFKGLQKFKMSNFFALWSILLPCIRTNACKMSNFLTFVTFCGNMFFMRSDARVLTEDEKDQAYGMAVVGDSLVNISKSLKFSDPKVFWRYRQTDPEFAKCLDSARVAGCEHIEDQILSVVDDYPDARQARVKLESLCKALEYRNPVKYSPKMNIQVNHSLDIGGALQRMDQQLAASYIDITPQIAKPNDSNELW